MKNSAGGSSRLYFAYGSNLSTRRLLQRAPSATVISVARLDRHRLSFHKRSHDGSAKCDIEHTGQDGDVVYGVVFKIKDADKRVIDRCEGLGNGYQIKTVRVTTDDGSTLQAFTYYATHIDPSLKPYHWYKEHVLRGAREFQFPPDYIRAIEQVASRPDPDPANQARELAIYD